MRLSMKLFECNKNGASLYQPVHNQCKIYSINSINRFSYLFFCRFVYQLPTRPTFSRFQQMIVPMIVNDTGQNRLCLTMKLSGVLGGVLPTYLCSDTRTSNVSESSFVNSVRVANGFNQIITHAKIIHTITSILCISRLGHHPHPSAPKPFNLHVPLEHLMFLKQNTQEFSGLTLTPQKSVIFESSQLITHL